MDSAESPPPNDDPDLTQPAPPPARGSGSTGGRRWQPPTPEELHRLLPQYEITRLLGRGGMGAVYRGTQINLERAVAIKILPPGLDEDDGDANYDGRFKNEARAMAKLAHPGIVNVFDFGETADGLLYIVMEFVEGTDVQMMVAEQGRLHSAHALAITAHVCDALQYAHDRGIIHRDIKPANIMVGYDGVVKVADFGLAKMDRAGESGLTRSGVAMGTLHYMAPEALMLGTSVDHRADIYAVGVMLYFMLTGRLPQGMFELPSMQVPGLDPRYDKIIAKALRDDREIRYQSAAELRMELDGIITQPVPKVEAAPAAAADGAPGPASRAALSGELTQLAPGAELRTQRSRPGMRPVTAPRAEAPPRRSSSGSPWLWVVVFFLGGYVVWSQWLRAPLPGAAAPSAAAPATGSIAAGGTAAGSIPPGGKAPAGDVRPLQPGVWHDLLNGPQAETLDFISGTNPALVAEPALADGRRHYRAKGSTGLLLLPQVWKDVTIRARFGPGWTRMPSYLVTRHQAPGRYISGHWLDYRGVLKRVFPNSSNGSSTYIDFVRQRTTGSVAADAHYELELKAAGMHYTLSINGVICAMGEDSSYAEGRVGFSMEKGALLESLEVMPLDGLPPGQSEPPQPAVVAGAPTAADTGGMRLVVDADFTQKSPDFPDTQTANVSTHWESGKYTMKSLSKGMWRPVIPALGALTLEYFVCDLTFRVPQQAAGRWGLGIVNPRMPWIGAGMDAAGRLDIYRYEEALLQGPAPTRATPAGGDWNRLQMEVRGGQMRVFVNNSLVARVPATGVPAPHALALFLETPEPGFEVSFGRISVWAPGASSAAPAGTPASSPAAMAPAPAVPMTYKIGSTIVTQDKPFINSLRMPFVPVPGSQVLMCVHPTRKRDFAEYAATDAQISTFWQYRPAQTMKETEVNLCPVSNVSWLEAVAFCEWLSRKEQRTYRLPTDREWSLAVGIGGSEDPSQSPRSLSGGLLGVFAWGTQWPPPDNTANLADSAAAKNPNQQVIPGYTDGYPYLSPVMSFPPNKLGIYDMSGNVFEWCQDWSDGQKTARAMRGGAYNLFLPNLASASHRNQNQPDRRSPNYGFRCVLEAETVPVESAQAPAPAASPKHVWMDNKSRKITAEFLRADATTVILRVNGREFPIALSDLSAESRQLAEQLSKAGAAP